MGNVFLGLIMVFFSPEAPAPEPQLSEEVELIEVIQEIEIPEEVQEIVPINIEATTTPLVEEVDYKKQCVYCARQLSPYQPQVTSYAKDIVVTMLEPRLNFWAIYGAGCQYSELGHTGVVSYNINLDEGWFVERGCNLDNKGGDYTRKVYFKGEKKDKCLRGFYGHQSML